MGIVVDEKKAYVECECYQLPGAKTKNPPDILCYSKGVRGALSDFEDTKCKKKKFHKASPEFKQHLARFGKISKDCSINQEKPKTYKGADGKTKKVTDLVSRSRCILAKSKGT